MTDPLDSLRRSPGSTEPDAEFRRGLLARLAEEMAVPASRTQQVLIPPNEPMEITMSERPTAKRHRVRVGAALLGAAAVFAAVVVLTDGTGEHGASGSSPSAPTSAASTSTSSTSTTSTTIAHALSDAEVAVAGLLKPADVGLGWVLTIGDVFHLDRIGGPGTSDPACGPFLDTVFENPRRPASVEVRSFANGAAGMQQYIVVFPTDAGARAMMTSIKSADFSACLAAITTAAYRSIDPSAIAGRSALVSVTPPAIDSAGEDEMAVLAMSGTYLVGTDTYKDEGPIPFIRVGRAVMFMNPNTATAPTNVPGYTLEQLHHALSVAVRQLRDAQRQGQ